MSPLNILLNLKTHKTGAGIKFPSALKGMVHYK